MDTGYGPRHAKLSVLFFIISQTASAPAFSFRSHSLCSVAYLSRQEKQAQIKCPPCCDQDGAPLNKRINSPWETPPYGVGFLRDIRSSECLSLCSIYHSSCRFYLPGCVPDNDTFFQNTAHSPFFPIMNVTTVIIPVIPAIT